MPFDAENAAEDAALMARYARGEAAAARALTLRFGPPLLAYAERRLGRGASEAEDVVQESFLRLWRQAASWGEDQPVWPWLLTVARHLTIDRLRAAARRPQAAEAEAAEAIADPGPSAVARLIAKDEAAALGAALSTLPGRQRKALVLRHLEAMSNPEIAAVMGTEVEAVESLLARGRRALKALLRPAAVGSEKRRGKHER